MAAEELVERVLAGDVDRQAAPAAPGAAPHLAQRGDGAGERRDDRRVQRADVDAELERVGGHDGVQVPAREASLELAALLGRVARAVGGDELGELGVEHVAHDLRDELDAFARLDEADRARAPAHEGRDDRRGLRERRARACQRLVLQRRVPHRDVPRGAGGAVAVDERDLLQPGQPLGELDRVGDRRAGQQDARLGAVRRGDPPQAAQDVRDVRAEHAAVHVRLVDDDDREVGEDVGPRLVVGEDPDVEHVGVREDEVRAPPDLRALGARRVAVVDRRPHAVAQSQLGDRARLVLRERLRRVQVERAGLRVAAQDVERRQVEAQRLAGRGAGRDDRRAVPRRSAAPRPGARTAARRRWRRARRAARGAAPRASRRASARAARRTPGARGGRPRGRRPAARPTARCARRSPSSSPS